MRIAICSLMDVGFECQHPVSAREASSRRARNTVYFCAGRIPRWRMEVKWKFVRLKMAMLLRRI